MELAPRMALLMYDDIPGVIGRIGTLFGAAGVNIANMTVSRNRAGGKALMALSIDSPAPPELVAQLREGMDEGIFHRLTWPEPVERVSEVLRVAAVAGASRSSRKGRQAPALRRRPSAASYRRS
jgi:ACT domain.